VGAAPMHLERLPTTPLVSVVVANHNYGRFLSEMVDSVLAQTYPHLELIVCDDGSTDDSLAVLRSLRQRDERIVVLEKPNGGQASAWNTAYRHAKGAIVSLLDPDDLFLPQKLARVVAAFRANPKAGLLYHRWVAATTDARVIGAPFPRDLETGWLADVALGRAALGGNTVTSVLSLRREVANVLFPLPEAGFERGFGDGYLQALAQFVTEIDALGDTLTLYRIHGDNDSGSLRPTVPGITRQIEGRRLVHRHARAFVAERFGDDVAASLRLEANAGYLEHLAALYLLTSKPREGVYGWPAVDLLRALPPGPRRFVWRTLFAMPARCARATFGAWWGHAPWKRRARAFTRWLRLR
jgi:glycosyltransferase involved in cell wall biosynthesis